MLDHVSCGLAKMYLRLSSVTSAVLLVLLPLVRLRFLGGESSVIQCRTLLPVASVYLVTFIFSPYHNLFLRIISSMLGQSRKSFSRLACCVMAASSTSSPLPFLSDLFFSVASPALLLPSSSSSSKSRHVNNGHRSDAVSCPMGRGATTAVSRCGVWWSYLR